MKPYYRDLAQVDRDEAMATRQERDRHREPGPVHRPQRRDLAGRNAVYVGMLERRNELDGVVELTCPSCSGPVYAPKDSSRDRVDCIGCDARLATRRELDGIVSLELLDGDA